MRYIITNLQTFNSIASWMPLTHQWDGGLRVELTEDEAALFDGCLGSEDTDEELQHTFLHLGYDLSKAKRDADSQLRFVIRMLHYYHIGEGVGYLDRANDAMGEYVSMCADIDALTNKIDCLSSMLV